STIRPPMPPRPRALAVREDFERQRAELLVNFFPLAHADEGQKILLAQPPQLVVRKLLLVLAIKLPELEQSEEIGAFVLEFRMGRVGGVLFVERALARVLDREGGDDD